MRKGPDMRERKKQMAARTGRWAGASVLAVCCGGCTRAPSFNILGSFFPSWILCGLIGIVLTVGARLLLVRYRLEQDVTPLIVVYPCMTLLFTFTCWLLLFS